MSRSSCTEASITWYSLKARIPSSVRYSKDAQFLFEHDAVEEAETNRGFDDERLWHRSMKKTSGEFADYPVLIAHLATDYPKRTKNAHCESWIVTTDLSLSSSLREVAHLKPAHLTDIITVGGRE